MKNRRLVLHVGRHKSGTSSLQRYLCRVADELAEHGVIYPATGREVLRKGTSPAHHIVAQLSHPAHADPQMTESLRDRLAEETAPYHTVIISSEWFQNVYDTTILRGLVGYDGFSEVLVVGYVREYLSYMLSSYAQMVQNTGSFATVSNFLGRKVRIADFFETWSAFGTTRFRAFDRDSLHGGDVIADFCEACDLPCFPHEPADANPTIGGNLLFFKLLANRLNRPFLGYGQQAAIAGREARFRGPFHIDDARARAVREASDYNRIVGGVVGQLPEKSFERYPRLPVMADLEDDLRFIREQGLETLGQDDIAAAAEEARGWF